MSEWTPVRRLAVLAAVALGILVPIVASAQPFHHKREVFCTLALAIRQIDGDVIVSPPYSPDIAGHTVALEDQGRPGRGDCDLPTKNRAVYGEVLGFDCKVRDPSAGVVQKVKPNRADGTCGQED